MFLGQLVRHGACVGQDVALVELQKGVEPLHPLGHVHRLLAPGLVFGEVEVVVLDGTATCRRPSV
jgi:hypothetical protein